MTTELATGAEHDRWVVGSVAANILHTSPANVIALAKAGRIERRLRRVSHATVRPVWMYRLSAVLAEKARRGIADDPVDLRTARRDPSKRWITAVDACRVLNCSRSSLDAYASQGEILTKDGVQFTYPSRRKARGYYAKDVLAIHERQTATTPPSSYEEETVLVAAVNDRDFFDRTIEDELRTLLVRVDAKAMTPAQLVERLRTLLPQ